MMGYRDLGDSHTAVEGCQCVSNRLGPLNEHIDCKFKRLGSHTVLQHLQNDLANYCTFFDHLFNRPGC
jgi:hypothetical protein